MFSIVATPIGNLEDITLRALRVLKEVDVVLCEDTRVTKKLFNHYEIQTPCISYHEHSGEAKYEKVFAFLEEGKHLALVSDAGMPAIADPGARLVSAVRERFGKEAMIEVVPGASAVTSALALAGFPADSFLFLGFPPHKKGRKTFFETLAETEETVVFYESPHRILKALEALLPLVGKRRIAVCRELTKLYEEVAEGSVEECIAYFEKHPDKVRGEFVVVVDRCGRDADNRGKM